MPKIGKRMIKSSIAVFLCFVVYLFRQKEGVVFYSCIAAVLCMQQDITNTKKVGWNRVVGTFIGGFIGLLVLMFEKTFIPSEYTILEYMLTSFMIIPIIYITVLLKKTSASYISCVVFMSITVSHGTDINPFLFAMNRIIDTLIGIVIAFGVNSFHFPSGNHKDTLYVSALDGTLLNDDDELSNYTRVKLKQLLERGANIVLTTSRTPSAILSLIQDIPFIYPIVVMNGAAMYDLQKQQYKYCKTIPQDALQDIKEVFEQNNVNCFIYSVIHHVLHVYYGKFQNPIEEDYYHALRKTPFCSYVFGSIPEEQNSIYVYAVHEHDVIDRVYQRLKKRAAFYELHVVVQKDNDHQGYSKIEIYSKEANKKASIQTLIQHYHFEHIYVFGKDVEDLSLLVTADKGFVVKNGNPEMRKHAEVIASNNEDSVIHKIDSLFHSRKK